MILIVRTTVVSFNLFISIKLGVIKYLVSMEHCGFGLITHGEQPGIFVALDPGQFPIK